jgi:Outer membrane protein beta-barrel domain
MTRAISCKLACVALVCAVATPVRGDGYYYEESFGVSSTRADVPSLDAALRLRLGIGYHFGQISIEPWAAGDLTFERTDSMFGIGGSPDAGAADFVQFGADAKYTQLVGEHVGLYVRGGPRFGDGQGSLAHYWGPGIGAGAGIQFSAKVRALGILFAPLFFMNRGPKITAAVFFDQGLDVYWLSTHERTIGMPIVSTNMGFGFGTDF